MIKRTLCITLGDPCGLGPELAARHLTRCPPASDERLLLIGPGAPLDRELRATGAPEWYTRVDSPEAVRGAGPGVYLFEPDGLRGLDFPCGCPDKSGGHAAGASLDAAIEALTTGVAQGLTTLPLDKASLHRAGYDFPGHTEFLAEGLGVGRDKVCMHLCGVDPTPGGELLRVSLVTTHPPLAEVPAMITRERILRILHLTREFLDSLELAGPLAVCGLNPHAGESGRIGTEEIETIIPALDEARAQGMDVAGPFPADTVFHFAAKGAYPAVVAMYHDQGLAPLKLLHFGNAVNVTLGLPFPRTSPDHGTGYDLVGTGRASVQSFRGALELCRRMVDGRVGQGSGR